ncbi:MAG TPA: glycosyltransferase family 2 protein [Candidatus Gastranaerophilaceae bacterium]|nr:glycosyltransferase family 2 protein [Candidatus Gastranaerophilaceae bacterium]
MAKISVVINTLNAQRLLKECLESVKDAYEIVICDMYSEDKTIEIAKEYNCKIVYHERTGIVEPARNWAMEQATGDWILILDADEIVRPELWEYLKKYADNPKPSHFACYLSRETAMDGKILKSWFQKGVKRFWKKGICTYTDAIHQMPITHEGKDFWIVGKNLTMIHYHMPSISSFNEKIDRYTDFELKRFEENDKKFSPFKLYTRSCFEFFKFYILKGGIFDGIHGFIFAKMQAYYKFIQWAKLYEKEFKEKNKDLLY